MDGLLAHVRRAQSQKSCPMITAVFSVLFKAVRIPAWLWTAISFHWKGVAMSETWTDGFLALANSVRPPPGEDMLDCVALAAFDNLTIQCNYSGFETSQRAGIRLDMTNWLSTPLPKFLAPNLDVLRTCVCLPFPSSSDRLHSRLCPEPSCSRCINLMEMGLAQPSLTAQGVLACQ